MDDAPDRIPLQLTSRLRQARFLFVVVLSAIVLGLLYGGFAALTGPPAALLTWWGTALRAVVAVAACLAAAGAIERRWSRTG